MSRGKQNFTLADLGKVIRATAKYGDQFRIQIEGKKIVLIPAKQEDRPENNEWDNVA
jgi:formylmethanofuran dehydrogenase subunit E